MVPKLKQQKWGHKHTTYQHQMLETSRPTHARLQIVMKGLSPGIPGKVIIIVFSLGHSGIVATIVTFTSIIIIIITTTIIFIVIIIVIIIIIIIIIIIVIIIIIIIVIIIIISSSSQPSLTRGHTSKRNITMLAMGDSILRSFSGGAKCNPGTCRSQAITATPDEPCLTN